MFGGALVADSLTSWIQAGGTLGLLGLCSKLYIDNRRLKLQERKDDRDGHILEKKNDRDGYGNLIQLLETRVKRLEESEQECQRHLTDAMRRIAQLEGYDQGQGESRQELTVLKSAEHLAAEKNRKGGE